MLIKKRQIKNINLWKARDKDQKNKGKDHLFIVNLVKNKRRTKSIKGFNNNKQIFSQNAKLRKIKLKKKKIKNFFLKKNKKSNSLNQFSKYNLENSFNNSYKSEKKIFIKKLCKNFLNNSLNLIDRNKTSCKYNMLNINKMYSTRYSKNKNFNSFLKSKTKYNKRIILIQKFKRLEKEKKCQHKKLNFFFSKNL